MIILKNERNELFQWDMGQRIVLLNEILPTEVHFQNINSTHALVVELIDNEAPIPNILLQEPFPIEIYLFYKNNNESHTIKRKSFSVIPRLRPTDYVYTETEVFRYETVLAIAQRAAEDASSAVQVAQGVRDDADAGVFKGDKGNTGDPGLIVSEEEPSNPDVGVWLNPQGALNDTYANQILTRDGSSVQDKMDGYDLSIYELPNQIGVAVGEATTTLLNAVSNHDTNSSAHGDLRDDLRTVESIARGKATALTFDTLEQLNAWLDGTFERDDGRVKDDLVMGDNLYIRDVGVKDYWWDGESAQVLEAEAPDLTDYYRRSQVDAMMDILIEESDYQELVSNGQIEANRGYRIVPDGTLEVE